VLIKDINKCKFTIITYIWQIRPVIILIYNFSGCIGCGIEETGDREALDKAFSEIYGAIFHESFGSYRNQVW
jgi:hypothetical protein